MRRFFGIALQVAVWAALAVYLIFATMHCRREQRGQVLQKVDIVLADSSGLITPEAVRGWLDSAGMELEGRPIEQVDVRQMAGIIAAQPAVKGVDVYTEQSGTMHIGVAQRRPVMRIALGEEGDVLLSGDMQFIPADLYPPQYLPVVTGEALAAGDAARDEKNLLFLGKLINFVESLNADPLWSSEIVQIVVHESSVPWGEPEVELVPATGRYTILMGELDDTQRKLEKLALMYRNVLPHEGWDTYAVLDARYDNQVVCRK